MCSNIVLKIVIQIKKLYLVVCICTCVIYVITSKFNYF